ncbi:MAG: hypothetical protein WCS94_25065 [Verrucomicrobiota bacterium]
MKTTKLHLLCLALALLARIHPAAAQGTAFTYQGQLHDGGTNANGNYAMIFTLYDAPAGGHPTGGSLTNLVTLANGLFSVNLDFGAGAFDGTSRWLGIKVGFTNGSDYLVTWSETLAPRVPVLPAPYALYANTAGSVGSGGWSLSTGNYQVPNGGPLLTSNLIFSQQGVIQAILPTSSAGVGLFVNGKIICKTNELSAVHFDGNGSAIASDGDGGIGLASGGNLNFNLIGDINLNSAGSINLTSPGSLNLNGGNVVGAIPQMQVFTNSGTFVVPTNVTRIMVEMWGGGGGGGGNGPTPIAGVNYYTSGGGGGAGGYQVGSLAVNAGSSYTVTVGGGGSGGNGSGGSGGSTSFGNQLMTAGGGVGGQSGKAVLSASIINHIFGPGGPGGYGRTFSGGAGQSGGVYGGGTGGGAVRGGGGGWSSLGSGGSGVSPGGGGSGASGNMESSAGAGAPGAVIIYY